MIKNNMSEYETISVDNITNLLDKYKIGKKPLAKLLGWGETTIIRYIEGDIPTKEYSDKLFMIMDNPGYFYEILLKNETNITGVAYRKSVSAVLNELMKSKINVVTQYIINLRHAQISLLELQNMLYYIQGFYLAFYDTAIFDDEYRVTTDYIPYPKLNGEIKGRPITMLKVSENALSAQEKKLIEEVVDAFDWYGQKTLNSLISYERAMLKISRDKDNNKIVTKETLRSYFKEIKVQYGINYSNEINKYPDMRFLDLREDVMN